MAMHTHSHFSYTSIVTKIHQKHKHLNNKHLKHLKHSDNILNKNPHLTKTTYLQMIIDFSK